MFARFRTASAAVALLVPLTFAGPAGAMHDGTGPHARATDDACPPGGVQPAHFRDVPADQPHGAGINCVAWWDVAAGKAFDSYQPDLLVTREQMASFLRNLIVESGGTLPSAPPDRFADDEESVHEQAINALAEAGVVSGRADGSFDPRAAVQRGQMATFLVQAYEYRSGAALPAGTDAFSDDNGNPHEPNINKVAAAGFAAGLNDGRYGALKFVRRDQMASFLARVLDLLVEDGLAAPPPAAAGEFDIGFGEAGAARIAFGDGYAEANDVALARDGAVVLAGQSSREFGVARLRADGTPDPAFDGDGRVTTPIATFAQANAVVVQADGKIVAAGHTNREAGVVDADFALVRYNVDGSLDTTFGGDGIVTTSFPAYAAAVELVLQPDGALVAGGSTPKDLNSTDSDFALARYLPDGTPDPDFGTNGVVVTDVRGGPDFLDALLLQPDGAIVAGGISDQPDPNAASNAEVALVRYLRDGQVDTAFGDAGVARTDVTERFETVAGLARQSDGSLVAAGRVNDDGVADRVLLVRFTPAGALDTTFGVDGIVVTSAAPQSAASAVAVDADDRIVVVGRARDEANGDGKSWIVARYLRDGALDETFGQDGVVRTALGSAANAVALQDDGRIVVAGCDCPFPAYGRGGFESRSSFVVACLLAEAPRAS